MATPRFQALTVTAKQVAHQIITDLNVFEAFDPHNPPAGPLKRFATKALWDTGATKSVISPAVVVGLSLSATGAANVSHAGGSSISKTYVVNFGLPNGVMFIGVMVSEFPGGFGAGFEALIGMDIIGVGDFSVTNFGGQTCMSFRTPSMARVDYVAEHNRLSFAGTGRNEPCPCGATDNQGRAIKFKRCHGASA